MVDQPGVGGLQINRGGYLEEFGPGHFNFTFIIAQNGFNEDELHMLKVSLTPRRPFRAKMTFEILKFSIYENMKSLLLSFAVK